jgi:BlaI family penicillinase repressor
MPPRKPKRSSSLSESEWEVMKVIWEHGPMALGDIHAKVDPARKWAYSTVKTLIRRMTEKGWLEAKRVGNSFLYRPAMPKRKAIQAAIEDFSDRVLDGLLSPFVAYYAERKSLSKEDLDQLEEIVRQHREKKG